MTPSTKSISNGNKGSFPIASNRRLNAAPFTTLVIEAETFRNRTECRLCEKIFDVQRKMPDMASGNEVILDKSYALNFDGSTHVEIGNFPEFKIEDTFTFTAWVHIKEINDYRIIDKSTGKATPL